MKELKEGEVLAAYARVFNCDAGRIVLSDLSERFGFNVSFFNPDPVILAHNTGLYEAALYIHTMVDDAAEAIEEPLQTEAENGNGN